MVIESAVKSDVGRLRKNNEDAFFVHPGLHLFVVADGMGGHQGGQTASRLAVATLGEVIDNRREEVAAGFAASEGDHSPVTRVLSDGIRAACAAVFEAAHKDVDLQGMGTTMTALILGGGRAFVAHVGDSRCYLQRGDRIVQITSDHSLVNEQVKAGILTWEDSRRSPLKNIITRSVGFERDVAVDTFVVPAQASDKFLLCSDGLANLVDDAEIGLALAKKPFIDVPERLVALACERGGDDNITVVCVKVETL